jgi:tape measure domain-containing protein
MTASTTIEREIVQMYFDGKDFKKGVQGSIDDLDQLKKSMNMKGASRSFGELEKASRVDFSPLGRGLDSVSAKIGIMQIAAITLVSRITNAVIDGVKKLGDALIIAPVRTGMEEYETQLNSVQTILANTKKEGTELSQVTDALDELNRYADLTIYNFTQMTKNIGTFTAAGVKLDTSVQAIKGIANLAAASGSDANQASTAMYQLSQAISSGTVKLMDWNSVQNAGMGGQLFQDSLLETARVHGIAVDNMIENEGSFRDSLTKGWLTSEVLLETLSKFTGDLTDDQLLAMGYTQEQIIGIQEMAETANDAATKIKTLTQLGDTMAEALQSGWAETWRTILGDFEEAKDLWGRVAEVIGGIIDGSSRARNDLLNTWADVGGRDVLLEGFFNLLHAGQMILESFSNAISEIFPPITWRQLFRLTLAFRDFTEKIDGGYQKFKDFRTIIKGIAAVFDIVKMAVLAVIRPFTEWIKAVSPGASNGIIAFLAKLAEGVLTFREFAIETDFFNGAVAKAGEFIGRVVERVRELLDQFTNLKVVQDVTKWFKDLEREDFINFWYGLLNVLKAIAAPFVFIAVMAKRLAQAIGELQIIQKVAAWFKDIDWSGISNFAAGIAEGFENIAESVKNSDLLGKFVELLNTFDGRRIKQFFADAVEGFGWLGTILDSVKEKISGLKSDSGDIAEGIGSGADAIAEGLGKFLDKLIEHAKTLDYSMLFDAINTGLFAGIFLSIRKIAKGWSLGDVLEDSDIGETLGDIFGRLESTLGSFQNNIRSDTLKNIAIAIALLAGSLFLLTLVDTGKLAAATAAIGAMIVALFGASGALKAVNPADAAKSALALVGLAVAVGFIAFAMSRISGMDGEQIRNSLFAMGAGLAGLVVAINNLSGGTGVGLFKTVGLLMALSIAILVLGVAVKQFGNMDEGVLEQGILSIALSLGVLVASMAAITHLSEGGLLRAAIAITGIAFALLILGQAVKQFGNMKPEVISQGLKSIGIILAGFAVYTRLVRPEGTLGAAIAITIMSAALLILQRAISMFGKMKWDEIIKGLVAVGGALLILVIAANLMTGALTGAFATIIMAGAILILAAALKVLSSLTWGELLIAIVALAATFIILGLAAAILTPLLPSLIVLGIAMALIGAGALLLGAGLALAALGLVLIAGSAAAIAAAIGLVGGAIIAILPNLATAIAEALTNFITIIGERGPQIAEGFKNIILAMITAISELIPEIVAVIMDMIQALLDTIVERLPDLIQSGYDILTSMLQGIADNIAEVVALGLEVLTEFINGLNEGIPDLVEAAFSLLLTFLESIQLAIEEYMPMITGMGIQIGISMVEGTITGLLDSIPKVASAIGNLVDQAIAAFTSGFQSNSPSRVTYRIAEDVVQGFINGVRDGTRDAKRAMQQMALGAEDGFSPIISAMAGEIDEKLVYRPEIVPVLNMGEFNADAASLNDFFAGASILAELEASSRRPGTNDVSINGKSGEEGSVTFVQNNYSPKPLDRTAIYRDTKTHVAQLNYRRTFG